MDHVLNDPTGESTIISMAHSNNLDEALKFKEEALQRWPGKEIMVDPLSLSVSCHIGPGSLAITCAKKLDI
jgi:fatty acid-binding protein DegV